MIVDAYCHCGVSKYQPVEEVLAAMDRAGVDRAMLCQHLGEYDNRYLAEVVERYPSRFTATCLVDPESAPALHNLRHWHSTGCFRGLRILSLTLEKNFDLCLEATSLGMNLVLYAPDGIAKAVDPLRRLASQGSAGHVVIPHLGNPRL